MLDQPRRVIAAACDGACSGNPGPGGWGALLRFEDGAVRELGGADPATTNNRMELTAALALYEALRDLPRHPELVIRTDSRYLIDGLQKWLPGWKRKGWRTASGGAVLNRDLWEQLDRSRLEGVSLVHVRGHSGDPDNDRCDAIAVAFSRGQRPQLSPGPGVASAAPAAAAAPAPGAASQPPPGAPSAGEPPMDPAPAALQRLLGRLELADRLAAGGHGLSLAELAQLVEMPLRSLEQRSRSWRWRDWQVHPLGDGRWRLERDAQGLQAPE
ncbi:MAG: ribonuclease H [Synechococcus sp.]|nr:ribonuclease H [Synechococcus sp.]